MEQIFANTLDKLKDSQREAQKAEKKRTKAKTDTDISELEHLAISAKYHMPLETKFPKYFLQKYCDKYSRAAHTTLEFIIPFKSIVDFCKWKVIPDKKTWDGETIDAATEKHIGNIISIVCLLGFKGVTDKSTVFLPVDPKVSTDTKKSLISRISSAIPASELDSFVKDMSWKSLLEKISKYMTTISDISYEYNARENSLKQVINSRWEIIDDKHVKPVETEYDPTARQRYINIHLASDQRNIEEIVSNLSVSDVFGMDIKTSTHDIDGSDKMIPEHMNDPKNSDYLAELMLDVVKEGIDPSTTQRDVDEAGIVW